MEMEKDVSRMGYKQKGGTCCGTCSYSRHMFSGLFVCIQNGHEAVVRLLDVCDEYQRYEKDKKNERNKI